MNVRTRVLVLVLLAVIPAFALMAFSAWQDRAEAEARVQRQTRQLAELVAGEQNRVITESRLMLATLANTPIVLDPALLPHCGETLARIRKQSSIYANIGWVDPRGGLQCSAIPFIPPIDFSDRNWFRLAVNSRSFAIGDYLVGRLTGIPSLGMGYPVYADDGSLEKVLYATIDLAWLDRLAAKLPLPPGSVIAMVDANGVTLARYPDPQRQWIGKAAPETGPLRALLAQDCRGYAEVPGVDGVMRLNAIEPLQRLEGKCVYVRVGVPKAEIYGPIERRTQRHAMALGVVSLAIFGIAWFGSDWFFLRQVRPLALAARRIGQGDVTARTGLVHAEDELGLLAKSFDEMAAGIETRESRLAESDRALRRANRALTVLSAGNRAMLHAKDEQTLLDDMCRLIVERAGYAMAWVGALATDGSKTICPLAHFGVEIDRLDPRNLSWDETISGDAAPGIAIRSNEVGLFRYGPDTPRLTCMEASGCKAALALPLSNGGTWGVLVIYATEQDAFDAAEIELLGEAAADLAFGVGRLRDQTQRREAEEANRIKTEFLANMSHELRTPLNAIIGFSDVLKDGLLGALSPRQQEYVYDIYRSGQHLLSLINDILDLSKVEAGRMELDLEETAVATLLENSLSIVRETAAAHGIVLNEQLEASTATLSVDRRKVKQIIYNLLSNAIKFTPPGGQVSLQAHLRNRIEIEHWSSPQPYAMRLPLPQSPYTEFLELSIEDSGIGIRPEDAPRLFQPFSQLDSSLARRYEGTGLGLVMVLKMVQLHGGALAVSSTPGQGSCFTVWLPWRQDGPAQPKPHSLSAAPASTERTALIVEDDNAAAEILRVQLSTEGLDVLHVTRAEEALALMDTHLPALIVVDLFLPGMDGWDFLIRCKAPGSVWADVPVVIASIAADSHKGFSLGAAQVLQKPVSREDLGAVLLRLGLGPPVSHRSKVLIVDDDPKAVEILSAYLAESNFSVLKAHGGKEGIALVQQELPDLLVLDLMMPDVTGFDVVEALKALPATMSIPIIVVTAKSLTAEDRALLNGSVATIMEKSNFNQARFSAEVRRALALQGELA